MIHVFSHEVPRHISSNQKRSDQNSQVTIVWSPWDAKLGFEITYCSAMKKKKLLNCGNQVLSLDTGAAFTMPSHKLQSSQGYKEERFPVCATTSLLRGEREKEKRNCIHQLFNFSFLFVLFIFSEETVREKRKKKERGHFYVR